MRENLALEPEFDAIMYPSAEVLANCEYFMNLPQDTLTLYDELWVKLKS